MASAVLWRIRSGEQRDRTRGADSGYSLALLLCDCCRSNGRDREQVDNGGPQRRPSRLPIPVGRCRPGGGSHDHRNLFGALGSELPRRTPGSCAGDGSSTRRTCANPGFVHDAIVGSDHAQRSRKPNGDSRLCISGGSPPQRAPLVVRCRLPSRFSGSVPASTHRQRGQITVVFVVLAVVLVMLGGLAFDGAQILNARREASTLALEAARAGAQAISTELIYRDQASVPIDPSRARIAASEYLGQHNDWSISVRGDTVSTTVWLTQPLRILSLLGIDSRRVAGTATARAVWGISTGHGL